jgi:hypothetical protein
MRYVAIRAAKSPARVNCEIEQLTKSRDVFSLANAFPN